ncbi:soluble lytic murein transglycosylase-like protein [Paenibacillus sp. 1182]|uniref:transglycosylase SLT domain-containing protein n=1 Tax=Paenibacillus sp. 1182 TaxID=2806565 RepID=UPI001AE8C25A|nr:transglycosylase SLT domain-containing protein [Paenibacillus sp. 1182]MBP1309287.1 soluble lytic murein transglycosylase-like protein [Paenibacillus sp. 1182]
MNKIQGKKLINKCIVYFMIIVMTIGGVLFPQTIKAQTPKSFKYVKEIPMPKQEQKYLYQKVKARGLDYEETLATILQESSFHSNVVDSGNYGYFQVNKVNHAYLAQTLKTANKPLDPYINMNWGTYVLSNLYKKYAAKGLKNSELKEAVLSTYNKGEGGYKRTGKATKYIKKHDQSLKYIQKIMN